MSDSTGAALFQRLEAVSREVPGWSPPEQLAALFMLCFASAKLPGAVLEVGSWCGRSAIALAFAAKASGSAPVHSIDLFPAKDDWRRNPDGSYSLGVLLESGRVDAYAIQTVWSEPFHRDIAPVYEVYPDTLAAFRAAVASYGLGPYVRPHKGTLATFFSSEENFGLDVRLAFIDGDHSYDAVAHDIELLDRRLVPGGWICFDDAFSNYPGVDRAIEERILSGGRYGDFLQVTRKMFVARRV